MTALEDRLKKGIIFNEDYYLDEEVIKIIEEHHDLKFMTLTRHVRMFGLEIDAVAIFETPRHFTRSVGFELKENDLPKAIIQALVRRPYFHYFYIVIPWPPKAITSYILGNPMASEIRRNGVGIIGAHMDHWLIVIPSLFRSSGIKTLADFEVEGGGKGE